MPAKDDVNECQTVSLI